MGLYYTVKYKLHGMEEVTTYIVTVLVHGIKKSLCFEDHSIAFFISHDFYSFLQALQT